MRLSLTGRLTLSFLTVGVLLLGLGMFSIVQLNLANETTTEIAGEDLPAVLYLGRIDAGIEDFRLAQFGHYMSAEPQDMSRFETAMATQSHDVAEAMAQFEPLVARGQQRDLFESVKAKWSLYLAQNEGIFLPTSRLDVDALASYYLASDGQQLHDSLDVDLRQLAQLITTDGEQAAARSNTLFDQGRQLIIAAMVLALSAVGALGVTVTRRASRSVQLLLSGADVLRERESQLSEAQWIAHIGSWELDIETQQLTWSDEHYRLFGLEPGAIKLSYGDGISRIHPDDRDGVLAQFAAAHTQGKSYSCEARVVHADGTIRWLHSRGSFVADARGGPGRMVGTAQDITERKETEQHREAMVQGDKLRAIGQMASGVAHDINQSLGIISGHTDIARAALDPDSAVHQDLIIIGQAAVDGGETVNRLLRFARVRPESDNVPVNVGDLLRDVARLTAPRWRDQAQLEGRAISLHVEAEPDLVIDGQPASLREALTNLVFNAVDALPGGGGVRLGARQDGQQVVVEVADTGVGMPADVKKRIFEPFFTTKGDAGTGLGLPMVYGLIEAHGGTITVDSAPGIGTTFRLILPVAQQRAPVPAPLAQATAATRSLRVLAVDDDAQQRQMVTRLLELDGHLVDAVGSGELALVQLGAVQYDLVVSDLGMGEGISGWQLATQVGARWPAVKFALATGWGESIDTDDARRRSVDVVMAKPYRRTDLQRALASTGLLTSALAIPGEVLVRPSPIQLAPQDSAEPTAKSDVVELPIDGIQFAAKLAHDIAGPLGVVLSMTDLLLMTDFGLNAEGREILEEVHQGGMRASDILKGMRDQKR